MLIDTIRPGTVRPIIVMLASLLLAASALLATTTGALAAKPVPKYLFEPHTPPCLKLASANQFYIDLKIEAKGKWAYVQADMSPDGVSGWVPKWEMPPHRANVTDPVLISFADLDQSWGLTTYFRARVVDRKGNPLGDGDGGLPGAEDGWKYSFAVDCLDR